VRKIVFLKCKRTAKPHLKFVHWGLCSLWREWPFPHLVFLSSKNEANVKRLPFDLLSHSTVSSQKIITLYPKMKHTHMVFLKATLNILTCCTCTQNQAFLGNLTWVFNKTVSVVPMNQQLLTWSSVSCVSHWMHLCCATVMTSSDTCGASRNRSKK
jgi:hypothetical protein